MDTDFPAAHSMDTHWFAVDQEGRVACFSTGEAGAVPAQACAAEEAEQLVTWLQQAVPAGQQIHDLAGRCLPTVNLAGPLHSAWHRSPVLAFLTSLEPVRPYLDAGRAVQVRATEGVAVVLTNLTEEELQRLQAAPACRATCNIYEEFEEGEPGSLARRGVYVYDHLTENWISGPYGREVIPAVPLHLDQLPPNFRGRLSLFRFDGLRFADTPHLQPVEHAECVSWEAAYLDSTGKRIGPIPGREDDYADAYSQYAEDSEYEVEPPPGE